MTDLKYLFSPRRIAVVGASSSAGGVGRAVLDNIINSGFKGDVFPVNPKAEKIAGLQCYPQLAAIKKKIDLVIIIIPAAAVPAVLEEAGSLGVPAAIIISAGFKEAGRDDLEMAIQTIARRHQIAVLGPNCLGLINPRLNLNATFTNILPASGDIAFFSQSGALGTAVLDYARDLNLGFSVFTSVGNKAVLDETDFLNYIQTDKQTRVLGIYAEDLRRPEKLAAAIKLLAKSAKPVVVLKSGRTSAGANASASHTGAIAGDDKIYEAFLRDAGAIRARSISEFFDYLQIFSRNNLKKVNNLAIITNAGGPGVLAVDAALENNLALASLSVSTKRSLENILPAAASWRNPIDILGDALAARYAQVLDIVAADKGVDSILVLATVQTMTDLDNLALALIAWRRRHDQPLAVCLLGAESVQKATRSLQQAGIAVFSYPEDAARSLAALSRFSQSPRPEFKLSPKKLLISKKARKEVTKIFDQARTLKITHLPEFLSLLVLKAYSLPVADFFLIKNEQDAKIAKKRFSVPLALKIASLDILHKSDVQGIILNVQPQDISQACSQLLARVKKNCPQARIEGILVMPMAAAGITELIIGGLRDVNLGPALMLGWGGVYAETLGDVTFSLSPITKEKVERMLSSLLVKAVLLGARGGKRADLNALTDILFRLNALLRDFPEIKELDLNPVLAREQGALILDARLSLFN